MEINQNFVEIANARLTELTQQVELLSIIDHFDDLGNSASDKLRKDHLTFLSNKFGKKVGDVQEAVVELHKVRDLLQPFVQVDYLKEKFSKLSSKPDEVVKAFETVKNDNLKYLMNALDIEEGEV